MEKKSPISHGSLLNKSFEPVMLTLTQQTCVFEAQTLQRLGAPMGNVTSGPDYSSWAPCSIYR